MQIDFGDFINPYYSTKVRYNGINEALKHILEVRSMNTVRINEGSLSLSLSPSPVLVGTWQVAPFVYRDTRYTGS